MSNNKNNNNQHPRTMISVRKTGDNISPYIGCKQPEEAVFSLALLMINVAKRYGKDVTEVLDNTELMLEKFYEDSDVRKQTGDAIWQDFIEYDKNHENGNESLYDICDLPDEEVPLYLMSYAPDIEEYHMRNITTPDGASWSIDSLYFLLEVLEGQTGISKKDIATALYKTAEDEENQYNSAPSSNLRS